MSTPPDAPYKQAQRVARGEDPAPTIELAHALAMLLTQEEFRLVFSVQLAANNYGAYGAEDMTDEESEKTFDTLGAALAFGILKCHEAGHRFQGIRVDENGELFPVDHFVPVEGNSLYIHQLAVGRPINFLMAVQSAIETIEREGLTLSVEPLRTAETEIRSTLEQVRAEMSPEDADEIRVAREKVLRVGKAISSRGVLDVRSDRSQLH